MNLVIPVSENDAHLLGPLAEAFLHLGQCKGHTLIVCPSEGAEQPGHDFKDSVSKLFDRAVVRPVKVEVSGWPIGPNRQFRVIGQLMAAEYADAPWWFFEPDCTPVAKGWLQAAQRQYEEGRKSYCGALVPTILTNSEGQRRREGKHMVGCGIYPPDAFTRSALMLTLDRRMSFSPLPMEPFDLRMRMEIEPNASNLTILQHNWRTVNYRREDGKIVCDPDPDTANGHDFAKPVAEGTMVVHGCRDSSLARLVVGEPVTETEEPEPEEPAEEAPAIPAIKPGDFIDHKIREHILNSPKKIRLKELASNIELEEDVVRARFDQPNYFAKVVQGGFVTIDTP